MSPVPETVSPRDSEQREPSHGSAQRKHRTLALAHMKMKKRRQDIGPVMKTGNPPEKPPDKAVVGHGPADALQQPRRVLRLQLGDDEVVPHHGVPLLVGPARIHVRELKQHLALFRVFGLVVVPVRDKEVMESAIGDLRL
ncbi:hypothetical protein INR49_010915 [Caranx melampygus]|nr:hypothetical protein INR49_010915 [Caranx melampygus]